MKQIYRYLYQITNHINGKIYVGVHVTDDINDGYMGSGKILNAAIQKHGIENFTKTILEFFETSNDMFQKEEEIVNEAFVQRSDTYNIKIGGKGGFDYINSTGKNKRAGYKHSAVTKEKIRNAVRGKATQEAREASRQRLLKTPMASRPGVKDKMKKSLSSRRLLPEHKAKISETLKNKVLSDEERASRQQRMNSARMKKPKIVSNETRNKISSANKSAWDSGKRCKPVRDWKGIQCDIDAGMKKRDILAKYGIDRHVFDNGLKRGYIMKNSAGWGQVALSPDCQSGA